MTTDVPSSPRPSRSPRPALGLQLVWLGIAGVFLLWGTTTRIMLAHQMPPALIQPDVNQNGVRDDVEAAVTAEFPAPQREFVSLMAVRFQSLLLAGQAQNHAGVLVSEGGLLAAKSCVQQTFGAQVLEHAAAVVKTTTVNTPERRRAYEQAQAQLVGVHFSGKVDC